MRTLLRESTSIRILLLLLLASDLVFIVLHILEMQGRLPRANGFNVELLITFEGSLGESFQHLKEALVAVCLMIVAVRRRHLLFAGWSLLYAYLAADDTFQIHENFAMRMTRWLGLPVSMRTQDTGEIAVSAFAAAIFLVPIALGWWRASVQSRRIAVPLAALLGLLVFFGIGVDALHAMVRGSELVLGTLEDGGEMLAMSLTLAYVIHLAQQPPELPMASAAVVVK